MSLGGEPLAVPLPEPVGRRARLGPFPSGQDAAKFASYAGVGAVVAGATDPIAWLPFLAVGFAAAVVRVDGKGLDAHLADRLRFRLRAGGRRRGPAGAREPEGGVARAPDGRLVAVLETGGLPVAFLPRNDARALFDGYRALLGSLSGPLIVSVGSAPVPLGSLLPSAPATSAPEETARAGYLGLLRAVGRQRRRRTVRLAVVVERTSRGDLDRLERRVEQVTGHLFALGLLPVRLAGPELGRALRSLGAGGAR